MEKDALVLRIMSHVVPECYYGRMEYLKCDGIKEDLSYNDFLLHNKACLDELSLDDVTWIWGLCKRLKNLGMMDMECCGIWEGDSFFYNLDKELVLVHPR